MPWPLKSFSPTDSLHADDLNQITNAIQVWQGNVNGGGYHLSNCIIDNYFPGAGVPLLSPIHVIPTSTDYSSSVHLDSEAAGNPARWVLIKDQSSETGSNAGSNFFLERCDDTGNVIDSPIAINRASGIITMGAQQWSGNVNGGGFTLTNVVIPSVFNDPTTTLGDMIVRGSSGIARIAVGADGMMLTADHTQPLGVKWAISPAVMPTRQVIAGTGLGGGGPLSADVTLTANVVTVFGRTGAVVLTAADITGATGVIGTRQVLAGAGMTGGGALSADVTLNAAVTSVFGRTGAVVLQASDISTAGGVAASRQVIAGQGMSGGGALSADVTLNALVTSVFGRTGAVTLTAADVAAGGGVPSIRKLIPGTGIATSGNTNSDLTTDLTLSVVNDTSIQRVNWASGAGSIVGTRSTLNFIQGQNITIGLADNTAANRMDVTINSSGLTQVWVESLGTRGTPTLIGTRPGINFIGGTNVTITGVDNPTQNTVDLTFSAVGGTGTGTSQTPWLGPIDAAGETLSNVAQIGVNAAVDPTGVRVAVITSAGEVGMRVVNSQTTTYGTMEVDNDNATAKICLRAYGSQYGGTLQSTAGLTTGPTAPMTFSINNSEAMRISTGKRILIGTSTDDGTHILQVNGAIKSLAGGIVFPDGSTQLTAITSTGMQDPTTTLGDLIVRGSTAPTRLPIGANGQVLVANSAATNGLGVNWAAPPSAFWQGGSGGAIYYNGGPVGIGTTTPTGLLDCVNPSGQAFITADSYGGGQATLQLRRADGTFAAPIALAAGDAIGAVTGAGYDGTAWSARQAAMISWASNTWSTTDHSTYITFETTPSASLISTERMRINSAGNVGIGTATPGDRLHVHIGGTDQNLWVRAGNSITGLTPGGVGIQSVNDAANNIMPMSIGGSPIILWGGNVGIGTTTPYGALTVTTNSITDTYRGITSEQYAGANPHSAVLWFLRGRGTSSAPAPSVVGDFGMSILSLATGSNSSMVTGANITTYVTGVGAGTIGMDMSFSTNNGTANPSERMRITAAGLVGIGTAGPATKLDVTNGVISVHQDANNLIGSVGTAQLQLCGATTPAKALWLGYDTTNNVGLIQAGQSGVAWNYLLLNPNGGNVGVGTASPAYPLDVYGAQVTARFQAAGNPIIYILDQASGGTGRIAIASSAGAYLPSAAIKDILIYGSAGIGLADATNVRLYVAVGGNVGIGTVSPIVPLHVVNSGSGVFTQVAGFYAPNNTSTVNYNTQMEIGTSPSNNNAAQLRFNLQSLGGATNRFDIGFFGNAAPQLSIQAGGAVGVGTTNPGFKLTVAGDGNLQNNWALTQFAVVGASNPANNFLFGYDTVNNVGFIGAVTASVAWRSVTICPNGGNVGIGVGSWVPGYPLDVRGDINTTGQFRVNGVPISTGTSYPGVTSPGSGKLAYTVGSSVTTIGQAAATSDTISGVAPGDCIHNITGGTNGWIFGNGGTVCSQLTLLGRWALGYSSVQVPGYLLTLAADSTSKPTTNTWNTGSDIRLKRNIRPFTEGLETILKINPIRFEYNGRMRYPEGQQCVGIDAGAHKDILPDCVSTFRQQLDDDGPIEDVFSFNPHAILFMMINAFAELAKRIEKLETLLVH